MSHQMPTYENRPNDYKSLGIFKDTTLNFLFAFICTVHRIAIHIGSNKVYNIYQMFFVTKKKKAA